MAGSDNDNDDASVHSKATIAQQQRKIQPQIITTISNKNAKFPYLKKDEYEEEIVIGMDINLPPTTADEHIAAQRESKARTTLLQSIPDDHAKPEDKDINLKFLRALPSSWSQVALTLKTKGPSHFAFVSTTSASKKMSYADSPNYSSSTYNAPSNSKTGSHRSGNAIEDVLQLFVADTEPYNNRLMKILNDKNKWICSEIDLKCKMAMLLQDVTIVFQEATLPKNAQAKGEMTAEILLIQDSGICKEGRRFQSQIYLLILVVILMNANEEGLPRYTTLITGQKDASTSSDIGEIALLFVPQAVLLRTGKVNIPPARPQPVPTGKPKVPAPVPTGRQNRPFPVPTNRGYSPSERLDDFQEFQGGKVTFGGGEGRITGKGAIRTLTLDFEKFIMTLCFQMKVWCGKAYYESVKRHRRMGHVNYKDKNKIGKGIKRDYSNAKTPQQNGVAERKNRTLIEAARTMLADSKLPTMFWTEAVRTACYVLNRVLVTSPHNKKPYALLTGNIPPVNHFKPFGCHVSILNISDHLGKFNGKANEGYIVGYSASNRAYRVYNMPNKRVEETMNQMYHKQRDKANQSAGTQEASTNPTGTQDADSDSECDEQVIIVPSYPSNSIQEAEPKHTSGDEVDDSPLDSAEEIFQQELARLKGQEQRATSDAKDAEELQKRASTKTVPTGSIPVPSGDTTISPGDVSVPTGSVPVPTGSPTDSFFDDEPTTRFPSPSDLGNNEPSPGIFSSSSYDDEFGADLNNLASTVEVDLWSIRLLLVNLLLSVIFMTSRETIIQTFNIEEMQQFKFQNVWVLVDLPEDDLPITETILEWNNLGIHEGKLTFYKNKFSPQWRFLVHTILHCLSTKSGSWDQFGSSLVVALIYLSDGENFNYMKLNFEGQPMQLLAAMLPQDQAGEGVGATAQAVSPPIPAPIPKPVPEPDQPQDHLSTPPRQQTPLHLHHLHQVSTFVQKVNSLETELKAHKKLFKDVVGKLVKKVKAMEAKLQTKKRKVVISDSDQEEGGEQAVDLDALIALANAAVD
ncbi:putative ribonuclease H-like domain-containing protein [Tanacetum coccineum]